MADREKVIRGLECCFVEECNKCPYVDGIYCKAIPKVGKANIEIPNALLMDALELLKAQEPVDPAIGGNQNSCWYYICPICQLAIDKGDKYCRHCGQAVKWK